MGEKIKPVDMNSFTDKNSMACCQCGKQFALSHMFTKSAEEAPTVFTCLNPKCPNFGVLAMAIEKIKEMRSEI